MATLVGVGIASIGGCSTTAYYAQSVSGHVDLMGRAEPISELLRRGELDPPLQQRLERAVAIRRFASESLALPDNTSYLSYADLGRDQVVWTVTATEEFSTEAKPSCFLVVGCLSYHGYFAREDAEAYAAGLRAEGYETALGSSDAYSTLGWFDDPLLNTIVARGEARMVEVIFHELAHQRLYIGDDSSFNESFATAVARIGAEQWFRSRGDAAALAAWRARQKYRGEFHSLLIATRQRLSGLYGQPLPAGEMRRRKGEIFARLQRDYHALKERWGGDERYDGWMGRTLNNAHLALVATYNEYTPAFEQLLAEQGGDMAGFYRAAQELGALDRAQRRARLNQLLEQSHLARIGR